MKLAVIGGGGVRSMFLAKSLAGRAGELGITSLVFMDNDETKLNIYGKMARKVSEIINPEIEFSLTVDAKQAVMDADYVITTIREGGDEMRVRDERIALSNGVLGQETTGAAGFSFAIRSVNVLADYCELVRKYAKPDCRVFNFTNPADKEVLVTAAIKKIDQASAKGLLHKNNAARKKSALVTKLNKA